MTRILALLALVFCCVTYVYGDPASDQAKRVEQFHHRLEAVGTGKTTSIWVMLLDGESFKGTIDYLHPDEVGVRDKFGHLRPVPLKGIVEFTAQNRKTHVKTASCSRWRRAARTLWWHLSGLDLSDLTAPSESARFAIIEIPQGVALSSNG